MARIKNLVFTSLKNKTVLEIASGTGYWTASAAETAKSITAVDFSPEMLKMARSKKIAANFIIDDAYSLNNVSKNFNAGLANFWFSHIPKNKIRSFLKIFHNKLQPSSVVIMADNIYDNKIGGELVNNDNNENTYRIRKLKDGSKYRVLKNYYNEEELNNIFGQFSSEIRIYFGECYWWIKYKLE